LCNRVHEDEWSGTLFYSVEGDLGDDDFSIQTKELYLQDIGNSVYTEYDPSNPDFIKFLMDNPEYRTMKQGHIHSHNKMPVFFSGTDNSELVDNSEFHNYYVSLIVNNKNEMCGKVAFRATEKKETKTHVSFKGNDGSTKTKEISGTTEEASVYAYDCDIFLSDTLGESFETRFSTVEKSCTKRAKELAKKAATITKGLSEKSDSKIPGKIVDPYRGFSIDKAWVYMELYDDHREKGKNWREDKERAEIWSGSVDTVSDSQCLPRGYTPSIGGKIDPNVYSFLVKLISRDFTCEDRLSMVLRKLNNDLYSPEYKHIEGEIETYMDSLDSIAIEHYINIFPEDFHVTGYNKTLSAAIDILDSFIDVYPELISDLTDALNLAIDE